MTTSNTTPYELSKIASMRSGIHAARMEQGTFYGFYTGEHPTELWDDYFKVMPQLMFGSDATAIYAYQRTLLHYVKRMSEILADATQEA